MTKLSSVSKTTFLSKYSEAEEEEDDMASHSTEDPVRPGAHATCPFIAVESYADSSLKVRDWLDRPS